MAEKYVIIGAGAAGSAAARTLARLRPHDEVHLFSNEVLPTYYRPGLPDMLAGRLSIPHLKIADREHYARVGVFLHPEQVLELDPERQVAKIRGGREESYDRLLLATGARPFVNPNWGGRRLQGIFVLRKLEHLPPLEAALAPDSNVVVVGGGIRALQIAEALTAYDVRILLLVRESWIGYPLFTKPQGQWLRAHAEALGVEVRTLDEVNEFLGYEGRVIGIRTKAGGMLECNTVIVCMHMMGDMRIAQRQLEHADGFLVDEAYRTSVSNIYAAGDAAVARADAQAPRWRGWERAAQHGVRAAYAMAGLPSPPPLPPLVIAGRIFGVSYLHLGEPPLDVLLSHVEIEKSELGIAYALRSDGTIRAASVLGFAHCHRAMAEAFTRGRVVEPPLATLLDANFDWRTGHAV
ncbi:FAD-dependent oxidoreductase [bacterium]|nr:FAD-dependent oxidoreductase [bacterium]